MIIKQLSVFLENKSGRLTEVTEALASAGVNISAFSIADTAEFGILRMIVNKPEQAERALKDHGISVHITDVIGVVVPHEPGGLHRTLKILSAEGISVEYMYAFIERSGKDAVIIFRFDDIDRAIKVLTENKIVVLPGEKVYSL